VLALGIGLNATVFTRFKGHALKPLPGVEGSARLGVVMAKTSAGRQLPLSYPDYEYLRDHDRAFTGLVGSSLSLFSLGLGNRGERIWGEFVTGNYFQVFGVRAPLGRTLQPSDEVAPGKHPVVVISDGLWRRAFGSDPAIIGKTIHLNASAMTIVGVAAPAFHGAVVSMDTEVFIPVMMVQQLGSFNQTPPPDQLRNRKSPFLFVFGRLAPGTSLATASAHTAVLSTQLAEDAPLQDFSQRLMVVPIWRSPYGAQTYMLPAVLMLGVMGALLLLIVCANVAGLVLVRGVSRRGEIALRLAIGASRARILRLLLIENLVLAIPGAALGLLLTWRALPVLWAGAAGGAPGRMYLDLSVDGLVVGFAVVTSCVSALLVGFMPALRSSRIDLLAVMKDDLSPRSAARGRFRAALVVAQVAVSLLLLVGAGLVTRSLEAARHADAGFNSDDVISVTVDLKPNGYDESRGRLFYEQLLDAVGADEGIEVASLAMTYPLTLLDGMANKVVVEGYEQRRDEDLTFLSNVVAPEYFRTLRIALVTGREFTRRDDASGQQVVIVNNTLARRFWESAPNAIGKRLRVSGGDWRTVIGVAQDVKYARLNEEPRPYVYLPFLQAYRSNMILHSRGAAGPVTLLEQARAHIQALDPNLPILGAQSLRDQTGAALGTYEMTARTLFIFGIAAMALAALGIYGLVSYTVKQSTHEIGIRMALGARRIDIVRRYLGRGLRLGVIGAILGIAAALATTRLLATLLYGVSATDVVSFAAASSLVLSIVLAASLIPAWRAALTNPSTGLRHQ
jgi:predicted permease